MKRHLYVCTFAMLLISAPSALFAADDPAAACERLILDYAWHWDHDNHDEFASLFAADASFQAAGRVHEGREEILAGQRQRTGNVITQMLFSNIRVTIADESSADATSYFMVHSEARPKESIGAIPTRGFRIIGEMAFSCSLTDAGWKISAVDMTPVFSDENLEDM